MYVLGICGSPRVNGNTRMLLEAVLKATGAETKLIELRGLKVAPCDGCEACRKSFTCHIRDDMDGVYEELKRCDAMVCASPVYFGTVSGQLKAAMDRTLCLYHGKLLRNKVGAAVAVQGGDAADLVLAVIDKFYGYHNVVYAGGVSGTGNERGEVKRDRGAFEDAEALGRRIVELAQMLK